MLTDNRCHEIYTRAIHMTDDGNYDLPDNLFDGLLPRPDYVESVDYGIFCVYSDSGVDSAFKTFFTAPISFFITHRIQKGFLIMPNTSQADISEPPNSFSKLFRIHEHVAYLCFESYYTTCSAFREYIRIITSMRDEDGFQISPIEYEHTLYSNEQHETGPVEITHRVPFFLYQQFYRGHLCFDFDDGFDPVSPPEMIITYYSHSRPEMAASINISQCCKIKNPLYVWLVRNDIQSFQIQISDVSPLKSIRVCFPERVPKDKQVFPLFLYPLQPYQP